MVDSTGFTIPVLIPVYEPGEKFISLINCLLSKSVIPIIVVNDGSGNSFNNIFKRIDSKEHVTILNHEKNLGKGAALKTGIKYIQKNTKFKGVVTADADGQHNVLDIIKIRESLYKEENMVLGVREELASNKTPLRSRIGNIVTQKIFYFLSGYKIIDTQTGLRGIPSYLFTQLLDIPYNRYEYEMEMLLSICKKKLSVVQVPIRTIYIEENESSHFNPIVDSGKIYFVLLRQAITSLISLILYFSLFHLCTLSNIGTALSLVISRIISAIIYFQLSRTFTYKVNENLIFQIISYLILVVFNIVFLWLFISLLHDKWNVPKIFAMFLGYTLFFICNFLIQKNFIFKRFFN